MLHTAPANRLRQAHYSMIQILYWVNYGCLFAFASVYLQSYGFSNTNIGLVLGLAYGFSALLQPAVASLFNRLHVRLNVGLVWLYVLIIALALTMLVCPLSPAAAGVLMVSILSFKASAIPCINSLAHALDAEGVSINFSFARSLGSVGFAICTSIIGRVLNVLSPRLLPAIYLCTLLILVGFLLRFRTPHCGHTGDRADESGSFFRRNPVFAMFLAGLLCICLNHVLIETFMLQIMQNIGGGSAELGLAMSLSAIVEVPVMMLYPRLRRRFGLRGLLMLCGCGWFVKNLITAFAVTPAMVYIAQLFQASGYALYVPLTVDLALRLLPEKDFLKGQSLAGSAYMLGGVFASFVCGAMMDRLGVSATLQVMLLCSLAGAVLFFLAARNRALAKQ